MIQEHTTSNRGGRRIGAGRKPFTLEGLIKRSSPQQAERLRKDVRRMALELLIEWARGELRGKN